MVIKKNKKNCEVLLVEAVNTGLNVLFPQIDGSILFS